MATSNKKKKTIAAVATAAVLLLGGTFAWQSISQTALNEASDVINPGGRLHDDFYIDNNGDYNSDIYVENFADDDIFARVKLSEYMEIVVNKDVEGAEMVETVTGSKTLNGNTVTDKSTDNTSGYEYEYVTHYFDQDNATDKYWNWTTGDVDSAQIYYMPTFNKNKDSLVADRNGMYVDRIGGISNRSQTQYEDYTVWADGMDKTDNAIYDADTNQRDEVRWDFENIESYENTGAITTKEERHTAGLVGKTNGLISMSEWLEKMNNGDDTADYWVYDENGWVYWSSPIKAGKTTGLLLDAIDLKEVMDDTWYYAIEAEGQFVTAGDVDNTNDTGFYAVEGEKPTENAEQLLEHIGAIKREPVTVTISSPFEFAWTGSPDYAFYDAESGYAPLNIKTSDGKEYEWEWTVEGSDVEDGQDASYVEGWGEYQLKVSPYEKSSELKITATAVGRPDITGTFTMPIKNTNGMMIMVNDDQDYFGFNDLQFDNDDFAVFVTNAEGKVQKMTALEIVNTSEVDPNTKVVRGDAVTIYDDDGENSVYFENGFYVDIAPTEDVSHVLLRATLDGGSVVEMYISIWYDGLRIDTNGLSHLSPGKEFIAYIWNEEEVPTDANGNRDFSYEIDWNGLDASKFTVEETIYHDDWQNKDCSAYKITHNCDEGSCNCVSEATEIKIKVKNANSSAQSGEASVYVTSEMPMLEIGILKYTQWDEWGDYEWDAAAADDIETTIGTELVFGVVDGYTSADWTLIKGEDKISESTDSSHFHYTFDEAGVYSLKATRNGWKADTLTITVEEAKSE